SMLITAVASFETLLSRILSRQFELFPRLLARSEQQFSLEDLQAFATIDDARDAAVERRVDAIMRDSFDDWDRWFEKNAGVTLSSLCCDAAEIRELFQRRHLVVHSDGRV